MLTDTENTEDKTEDKRTDQPEGTPNMFDAYREALLEVTERQRLEDSISSTTDKIASLKEKKIDLEDKSKELRSGTLKERIDAIQKGLGITGQVVASMALTQSGQRALKPAATVAKIGVGIIMTGLSIAFAGEARNEGKDRLYRSIESVGKNLGELDKKLKDLNETLNPKPGVEAGNHLG